MYMLMNRFLIWIGETFASRKKLIINDPCGLGPYLTRYYLLGARKSKWALMLHHFHRSDMDRDLHDHPWPFWSFILTGGYVEETPLTTPFGRLRMSTFYGRFSFLRRPANWVHRVVLAYPGCIVWTLVLRFGYERKWGFWTDRGWIAYDEYDYQKGCE
jgi:hypothetical protein